MQSVVSYPDRGAGGKNTYRGNCSPRLVEDLIRYFKPEAVSDYMVGGGTTEDVAKQLGVPSYCYDLNRGFDLVNMDIPVRTPFTFFHPPYLDIVQYSDNMYSSADIIREYGIDPSKSDLSRIKDWGKFIQVLNYCVLKQFTALEKGGYMAILMGDVKRRGTLYSMLLDIAKPGKLVNIMIKMQHNCWSDSVDYSGSFIRIVHEYLLIVKKENPLLFDVQWSTHKEVDVRDIRHSSWRDIVAAVLEVIGKPAPLSVIYDAVKDHRRAKETNHPEEKVRQTLYLHKDLFRSEGRGVWGLCA